MKVVKRNKRAKKKSKEIRIKRQKGYLKEPKYLTKYVAGGGSKKVLNPDYRGERL